MVIVLDQESTQQMVMRKIFNVTPEEPWLHSKDIPDRIFVVWDVPHLLKNVRNNARKYVLKVCTVKLIIKWH